MRDLVAPPDGLLADATQIFNTSKKISLKPGGTSTTIPLTLIAPPSGNSEFLIFRVDPANAFNDTNPANNTAVTSSKVTFV